MKNKILIIDDDASVQASLKRILENTGYDTMLAGDGVEAQPLIRGNLASLILLDLDMPRRDGWDVLEDLENQPQSPPVIIITGFWDQLATYRIKGAASLMSKPLEPQILLDEIARLLGPNRQKLPAQRREMGIHVRLNRLNRLNHCGAQKATVPKW